MESKHTKKLLASILEKGKQGVYRVEVKIDNKTIPIDVFPGVFPPESDYSISSHSIFENLGNLEGTEVVDIGSGSGIQSIFAILAGAVHVDATDINPVATECTRHNAELNNLEDKISAYCGDLFSSLPRKKYDLIIANLPIANSKPEQESDTAIALYDPNFNLHKRFFQSAKSFLNKNGVITFTHANLLSKDSGNPDEDFETLEDLIKNSGYKIINKKQSTAFGYTWINYKIQQNLVEPKSFQSIRRP